MCRVATYLVVLFICLPATLGHSQDAKTVLDVPPIVNLVADERTAVAIAVAILIPLYGIDDIERQKPFTAKLHGLVWHVEGRLRPHTLGSVAKVEIAKDDGRILSVRHR
jgi:hypothetical protein